MIGQMGSAEPKRIYRMRGAHDIQFVDGLFSFVVASTGERDQAIALVDTTYESDLGHKPSDEFNDRGMFLVAKVGEEIVGVLRYLPPWVRPFDLEAFVDLQEFDRSDRRLGLIGRLCVLPEYRKVHQGQLVQLGLLRLACAVSRELRVSDILLYSFPELVRMYRSVCFEPIGHKFVHPLAQRPMETLRLDLRSLLNTPTASLSRTARYLLYDGA